MVVVTGANSGIGLALARALHADGSRAAGLGLAGDQLAGLRFERCDVTDPSAVDAAIETIVRDWGRIDVLVNNACLAVFASFEERDLDTTRREFEVNFFGYLRLIAAVARHMKRQGGGVIINVGRPSARRASRASAATPPRRAPSRRSPARWRSS